MSKHEDAVKAKIDARCAAGFSEYKKTMERTDLTRLQWLQHAQDEAMDLAIYLQRLIDDESSERMEAPAEDRIDWTEIPWAKFVTADDDGRTFAWSEEPIRFGGEWIPKPHFTGTVRRISATIPGPWKQSLRKRPEGV